MGFIKVTQIERSGVAISPGEEMLLDVSTINTPLVENVSGDTIMTVQEAIMEARQAEPNNTVRYVVDENLVAVAALSTDIFIATIVTRNQREPVLGTDTLGFVASRIVGPIKAEGSGSKFFYYEDGAHQATEYVVAEDVSTIQLSL